MMSDLTVRKKFNAVSAAGLGVAKNGKLQFPFKFRAHDLRQPDGSMPADVNGYGQRRPVVGDFCACALPSGILSAGTVGRIVAEDAAAPAHDGIYTVQFLDGRREWAYRYGTGFLTEAQAKEVRDYYIEKEKRPGRIKFDFWS